MKISKYQYGSPIEEWGSQWKDRLQPSARSKVLQKWNASGKKPKPESSTEYTKRRIKEETKRTWRSDAADIAHGIGEGVLALHPYTAIPYYGAKVGQDVLNGNVNWETALNASIPLFHLSPQAVGLREATNVALEDAANAGSKTAKNWRIAREINEGIKQNTKNGKIEVTENYFNSPDKWYRVTETPEKFGIQEQGKNITTRDNSNIKGTIGSWRTSIIKNYTAENGSHFKIMPGKENNEGYFIKTPDKYRFSLSKQGAAHGNTSQAAKGQIWGGTFAYSGKFPRGILEGQAPTKIFRGMTEAGEDSRTNFILQDWDNVPHGARVGFHTGEMPMSNLGWFQRTNKGTYTYEPIIPEKRITYEPIKALEPSTSLKFFERRPARISEAERAGIPKGERNQPFKAKVPKITVDNAASITPEQWTAAQDAAIARGDMAEAQRLRDLHFKVNAPDTKVMDKQWHNANDSFNEFNLEKSPNGFYFGTKEQAFARGDMEIDYHPNGRLLETYLNIKNPKFTTFEDRNINKYFDKNDGFIINVSKKDAEELASIGGYNPDNFRKEYVAFKPNQIKLADAVTYDNNGVRIPLGKRDNFKINDIRYGLLPFGIGLTGYGLYKRKQGGKMNTLQFLKNGSGIHIKKKNRGKFTDYCGGKVTDSCIRRAKASGNPTLVKRATFADNARHFKHKSGGQIVQEFKLRKMLNNIINNQ